MSPLPPLLSEEIQCAISRLDPALLKQACQDLSARYRQAKFLDSDLHRYAYIAARLPATYGVLCDVLKKISPHLESCSSFVDVGAGVGSSLWAARDHFPHLKQAVVIEKDPMLIELGERLARDHLSPLAIDRQNIDLASYNFNTSYDVSLASYVLNELPQNLQNDVVLGLLKSTRNILILIEPGTPIGFKNILSARNILLNQGASIIAPCPHHGHCPVDQGNTQGWCHFSTRIQREQIHKTIKQGILPYEDEKYCYLVVSPNPITERTTARVIKAPIRKSGHIILDLCKADGQENRVVISKKMKNIYTEAKRLKWGDTWNHSGRIDESPEQS